MTTQFYSNRAYVDMLINEARVHRCVRHPYLKALADLSPGSIVDTLTDFGLHYYGYSAHFGRYLTATISRLESLQHRQMLLDNIFEESGQYHETELQVLEQNGIKPEWIVGIPHPLLFKRFRESLGIEGDIGINGVEVTCWREMFYNIIAYGSPAEAIGAIGIGTESITNLIYLDISSAIKKSGLPPDATVFFPLLCAVDDHHLAILKEIAIDLASTANGRFDLEKGMHKALFLRSSFWDFLYTRLLNNLRK
ncbi:MAG: iron-containing redox enzyme family protein [Dolichospermum sp.]